MAAAKIRDTALLQRQEHQRLAGDQVNDAPPREWTVVTVDL